jgi:hypothetical protein
MLKNLRFALAALCVLPALTLSGCALPQDPLPTGYEGPVAVVADTTRSETSNKAQIFAITEVDGQKIQNAFSASRSASENKGFSLLAVAMNHRIPAHPVKVTLRASHATGAPIHELMSRAAGNFYEVEGVVDFTPTPQGRYIVNGILAKEGSSVWIEDADTHRLVTDKINSK